MHGEAIEADNNEELVRAAGVCTCGNDDCQLSPFDSYFCQMLDFDIGHQMMSWFVRAFIGSVFTISALGYLVYWTYLQVFT